MGLRVCGTDRVYMQRAFDAWRSTAVEPLVKLKQNRKAPKLQNSRQVYVVIYITILLLSLITPPRLLPKSVDNRSCAGVVVMLLVSL